MSPRHLVVPFYVAFCILLGGASIAGHLANMVLQLAALPILYLALALRRNTPLSLPSRRLLTLLVLLLCLFAVQLVPLPPAIWTDLPGREAVAQGFALVGLPLPWMPLSLAPDKTIASLLWLLPAFAVLLGIVRLGGFGPSSLAWTLIAMTVLSVAVGALQVAGGEQSAAYFYHYTNWGSAVGFFANSNHLATLLLVAIPFLAALQAAAGRRRRGVGRASGLMVLNAGAATVFAVGLAISTSLAGVGLSIPTAAASVLMLRSLRKPLPVWGFPAILLLAAAALAAVLSLPLGNDLTNAQARTSAGSRYTAFSLTLSAAGDYAPAGSGIGTFVDVYRTQEDPAAIDAVYMNHAHSDLIEIALETGLPGLLLLALVLGWWVRRAIAIWRAAEPDHFARAATIASAAILAHSAVDYPLRTAAISVVFAACLALMAEPRPKAGRGSAASGVRHLSAG